MCARFIQQCAVKYRPRASTACVVKVSTTSSRSLMPLHGGCCKVPTHSLCSFSTSCIYFWLFETAIKSSVQQLPSFPFHWLHPLCRDHFLTSRLGRLDGLTMDLPFHPTCVRQVLSRPGFEICVGPLFPPPPGPILERQHTLGER